MVSMHKRIKAVVDSCETVSHVDNAKKYIEICGKNKTIDADSAIYWLGYAECKKGMLGGSTNDAEVLRDRNAQNEQQKRSLRIHEEGCAADMA